MTRGAVLYFLKLGTDSRRGTSAGLLELGGHLPPERVHPVGREGGGVDVGQLAVGLELPQEGGGGGTGTPGYRGVDTPHT